MGDVRRIVVVVEDKEAARTAMQWALHNLLRQGDIIVLLHVISHPPRKKKSTAARLLRRHGYNLALSFREICDAFFNTNTEIIVREGDEDGRTIAEVVKEIGASTLLVGLHQNSFLYRWAMSGIDVTRNLGCKVIAIKQPLAEEPPPGKLKGRMTSHATGTSDSLTNFDFSQIEISGLQVPEIRTPKVPYRLCPSPRAILWRSRPRRSKARYGVVAS
ncbi:Adenine nucleotide alpha hydrolases-like superfamily protein [Hirschfeldia incana]|nr:Adenine nucleotide alpha hydrolases-like superfamily protein [Hirschfeldia incana]